MWPSFLLPGPAPTTSQGCTLSFLSETAPTSAYSSPARSLGDTGITPLSPSHIAVRDAYVCVGVCADDLGLWVCPHEAAGPPRTFAGRD